ncbi:hypothetical protein E2320_001286 [Naja naja]|nr:hypothetical protein E2320_001286 [Naja naja]
MLVASARPARPGFPASSSSSSGRPTWQLRSFHTHTYARTPSAPRLRLCALLAPLAAAGGGGGRGRGGVGPVPGGQGAPGHVQSALPGPGAGKRASPGEFEERAGPGGGSVWSPLLSRLRCPSASSVLLSPSRAPEHGLSAKAGPFRFREAGDQLSETRASSAPSLACLAGSQRSRAGAASWQAPKLPADRRQQLPAKEQGRKLTGRREEGRVCFWIIISTSFLWCEVGTRRLSLSLLLCCFLPAFYPEVPKLAGRLQISPLGLVGLDSSTFTRTMEVMDVPVGNLIDFDSEPSTTDTSESVPTGPSTANGHAGLDCREAGPVAEESDATESADSENDTTDSPTHPSWNNHRRSSSESYSSNQSTESAREETPAEQREFEFDQEEQARFGELCSGENTKGREWFARYVSAQRCNSKCVSEQTFYRLVQSFAVVLFECYQMDDFSPAKNLMTIWLAEKKDIAERLLKNTSARTENMKGFFGSFESKLRGPSGARKSEDGEEKPRERMQKSVSLYSPEEEEERNGEKIYLGDTGEEEEKREKWCHMTQEERNDSLRFNENITFGQLGTFTHNMLAFGLNKKLCNDFLKKQAVIGNLDEEQYKLLSDHIDQMAAE